MDRDDQQYALMAAAAAAAYAQKKARDEARRALIISTALNQSMSNLDPDTQEQLRALLAAESRRVNQENLEWKIGWWVLGIIFGGLGLVFLLAITH
jgi:DNA-directed RNA polymerase subunit F